MQEIAANLSSPGWWFTAVLVAIVINIVSKHATTWTDRFLSKTSQRWTQRSERSQAAFLEKVNLCITSPSELQRACMEEMRLRSQAIYALLFGLTLMLIPTLVSGSGSSPASASVTEEGFLSVLVFSLLRGTGAVLFLVAVRLDSKAESVERICSLALEALAAAARKRSLVNDSAVDA